MQDLNWQLIFSIITPIIVVAGFFLTPWLSHRFTIKRDKLRVGKKVVKEFDDLKEGVDDLKEEVGSLRSEVKEEVGSLRSEVKEEVGSLRSEVKEEVSNLRSEVKEEVSNLRSEVKEEVSNLRSEVKEEVGSLRSEVGSLSSRVSDIDQELASVKKSTTTIKTALSKFFMRNNPLVDIEDLQSPVRLTELGQKLAVESGITEHIANNLSDHKQSIDLKVPEFELFNQCESLVENIFKSRTPAMQDIKQYFYEQGRPDIVMKRIYSLKLRDILLADIPK